jgi:hypothetical protein
MDQNTWDMHRSQTRQHHIPSPHVGDVSKSSKGNMFYVPASDQEKITRGFDARNKVRVPDVIKNMQSMDAAPFSLGDFTLSGEMLSMNRTL